MTEMKWLREDENKRANPSLSWQKVFLHPVYIGTREGIGDGGLTGNKRKVAVDERREKERKRGHSEIRRVLVQPERAHTADASTGIVGGTLFSGLKEASSQPKVTPRTGSLENGRERARGLSDGRLSRSRSRSPSFDTPTPSRISRGKAADNYSGAWPSRDSTRRDTILFASRHWDFTDVKCAPFLCARHGKSAWARRCWEKCRLEIDFSLLRMIWDFFFFFFKSKQSTHFFLIFITALVLFWPRRKDHSVRDLTFFSDFNRIFVRRLKTGIITPPFHALV